MSFKVFDNYFGGKGGSGTYQTIINQIRPHDIFISCFLGNDAVLRFKKTAKRNIGMDKSETVIRKWRELNLDWLELQQWCGIGFLESFRHNPRFKTVLFLDPPYPLDSRKSDRLTYEHELTDKEHLRILQAINQMKDWPNLDILICTSENDMYRQILKDWRVLPYPNTTRAGQVIEHLYMNYDNPQGLLHDYNFVGKDFRERERIKKKINRWAKRLLRLQGYERNAILETIRKYENMYIEANQPRSPTTKNGDTDRHVKNGDTPGTS